jgi:hypothetical protein
MRNMVNLAAVLLVFAIPVAAGAQEVAASEAVPCVLALAVADTMESVNADVTLEPGEGGGKITLMLPGDDPFTTSYILVAPRQIKFQLARIANERIATIQFVGEGDLAGGFVGRFWGFVDGVARPDMSGSFTMKRKG